MAIRTLKPGEPIPEGEPRRYPSDTGYMRLRWPVGSGDYVECYEHRVVMGNPVELQVHHKNGNRADNRPENLEVLTPQDHAREHRHYDHDEFAEMYQSGLSLPQISEITGADNAVVLRALEGLGIKRRSISEALTKGHIPRYELVSLFEKGASIRRLATHYGVQQSRIQRELLDAGCKPRRPGRLTREQQAACDAALEAAKCQ